MTTLAGTAGITGRTDGTGAAARFNYPYGITIDSSGNLYVADTNNITIRRVSLLGAVNTLAGQSGRIGCSQEFFARSLGRASPVGFRSRGPIAQRLEGRRR